MHRLIANTPTGFDTDHINGDKLDNRRSNLRIATHQQNLMNRRGTENSSSRFKGVFWDRHRSLWRAELKFNGKHFFLGRFLTQEEARDAYFAKSVDMFGAFARITN